MLQRESRDAKATLARHLAQKRGQNSTGDRRSAKKVPDTSFSPDTFFSPRPHLEGESPGLGEVGAGIAALAGTGVETAQEHRRLDSEFLADGLEPRLDRLKVDQPGRGPGPPAEVREDLADRPWVCDERDQPDIAATVWALEGKLLTHPGQQFRPCNPRGVVGAWLVTRSCVVASFRGMTVAPMPAGSRLAPDADVAFCHAT